MPISLTKSKSGWGCVIALVVGLSRAGLVGWTIYRAATGRPVV